MSLIKETVRQLNSDHSGRLRCFDLPQKPSGTVFQIRVRDVVQSIAFDSVPTGRGVATRLGNPNFARTIG